jgi:regulator of sigma E protease
VTYVLSFLFVLGVLVFIHELGHFLAARRVGIRVLTFSLGFGPKLVKVQRGDTEYCVSALPLGGYVKMAGEASDEALTGAPDEFLSKTKWQRFQVLIMGPMMNIVLAIVIFAVVGMFATEVALYWSAPPVVGVVTKDSGAERAGLMPGDLLQQVEGQAVATWEDVYKALDKRSGQTARVTYSRMGRTSDAAVAVEPASGFNPPDIGVQPDTYPVVRATENGLPAQKAGVLAGDVIRAVDGQRMRSPQDISTVISKKAGVEVDLDILRDGVERHIRVTPVERDGGKIGIQPGLPTKIVHLSPPDAIVQSFRDCGESIVAILQAIGGLITGHSSVKQLSGPIKIAQMSGEAARHGIADLFRFMAALSLNLGLLNLLPVPILDGGHILIMAIEGIARRDFSVQVKERMLMAGFVVLMMLMVTVFYNDLAGLGALQHLMKWRN